MKTDKLLKYAARHRMTPGDFGKMLTGPPHDLTCVEATQLMDQYKKAYPEMASAMAMLNDDAKKFVDTVHRGVATGKLKLPSQQLCEMVTNPQPFPVGAGDEIRASVRLPVLINRKAVKALALDISASKRAGKFERVGKSFLDGIEAEIRLLVSRRVMSHPSKGKTLK